MKYKSLKNKLVRKYKGFKIWFKKLFKKIFGKKFLRKG